MPHDTMQFTCDILELLRLPFEPRLASCARVFTWAQRSGNSKTEQDPASTVWARAILIVSLLSTAGIFLTWTKDVRTGHCP